VGYKSKVLKDEILLGSAFSALENVRTKETEELSIENMFSLGLGVPCVV